VSNRTTKILLAPNGKPSNLNEEQYYLVRTPEFKAWFGDWEKLALSKVKDPAMDEVTLANLSKDVSKVVDENGEPLVVYHGTNSEFYHFDKNSESNTYGTSQGFQGFFFTKSKGRSGDYALSKEELKGGDAIVISAFLSLKNPNIKDAKNQSWVNVYPEQIDNSFDNKNDGVITYNILDGATSYSYWNNNPDDNYIAFYPNQIKLADGSNTTFDGSNPDIRFDGGGEVEKLIEQGAVDLKMYDTTPEHAKEYGLECSNPLFIQNGIGEDVFKYIDEYAKENKHDLIFGHIEQKAEPSVDAIKIMLRKNGYSTIEGNNDFYKYMNVNSKMGAKGVSEKNNPILSLWSKFSNGHIADYLNIGESDYVMNDEDNVFVIFRDEKYGDFSKVEKEYIKRWFSLYKIDGYYIDGNKILIRLGSNPDIRFDNGGMTWSDYVKTQFNEEQDKYLPSGYLDEFEVKSNTKKDYPILLKVKNGLEYRLVSENSSIIGVFDADKQVADADDKVIQVAKSYQKKGIGLELVTILKERNPNHRFGSMTPEGWNLMGKYYDSKIANNPDIRFDDGGLFSNTSGENFWGNLGGGVLPICTKTKRILVPLRSEYVNEPNQIGVWGGKADEEEGESELSIINVVKREFVEETGYNGRIELIPAYVFQTPSKSFTYYNFIGLVEDEFTPILDWETKDYKWITLEELVKYENFLITDFKDGENKYYKHFGLISLLNDKNSMDLITKYADGGNQDIRFNRGGKVQNDLDAYQEAMGESFFDEGGKAPIKKVYVSIRVPYDIEKVDGEYFYKYKEKAFLELMAGTLDGVKGVSSSANNVAEWFTTRDALIVMNYNDFVSMNNIKVIDYDNIDELMANDLFIFRRLYNNLNEYDESDKGLNRVIKDTLSKIGRNISRELNLLLEVIDSKKFYEVYRIERFLNPSETSAFWRWIENNQIKIDSAISFTKAMIDFNKIDDNYLGRGFPNPTLTIEDLLPSVENGIKYSSKIYESEQEIMLLDRKLNIPNKSQLFFKTIERNSNFDELMESYKLSNRYKIFFVNPTDLERFRIKFNKEQEKIFADRNANAMLSLEDKKRKVLQELLQIFLNQNISYIQNSIEKNINEYATSKTFLDYDREIEYQWYDLPPIKKIFEDYSKIVKEEWQLLESNQVKDLNLYKFSEFQDRAYQRLKDYFSQNEQQLEDELYSYKTSNNYYIYLSLLKYDLIKSLYDFENLPQWLSYKDLSKMYLQMMGVDIYRYYNKNDLKLVSQ